MIWRSMSSVSRPPCLCDVGGDLALGAPLPAANKPS